MAEIGNKVTLLDIARASDPSGKIGAVAEVLTQMNPILEDMPFIEGNLPVGHLTTIRTGLPSATWRELNYGVQPSKSTTKQVTDTCGMLEAYAEVDKKLVDLNGNTAAFRTMEDRAFLEAMNQEMANTLFYGLPSEKAKFVGLSPRFSALSGADSSGNIINASGDSDRASIWLVCWGPNTVHGIFPKGSKAGLNIENLGQVTLSDVNGGHYEGYRTHYTWDMGLSVRDWRYVVRIANIDVAALTKDAKTGAALVDLMDQAIETLPSMSLGKPVFYCPKAIRSFLRRQIKNTSNVHLSLEDIAGKKVVSYDGIPVNVCEKLGVNETAVA